MESNKKVLKKAIIISMGAVVTILTLFLLYGLSTGRVQKTIVKYEALHYMENKYKEKFEIKQILGADKIWKTSWGYEIWMVPKNKPDKDYTSDMEVYVFKKNGKFYEDNYKESKKNYFRWNSFRKLISKELQNNIYFFIGENDSQYLVLRMFIFENVLNKEKKDIFLKKLHGFLKSPKKDIKIDLVIFIYNEEHYRTIKLHPEKMQGNGYFLNLDYKIEINWDEYKNIKEPKDIEKYIIDNRGN